MLINRRAFDQIGFISRLAACSFNLFNKFSCVRSLGKWLLVSEIMAKYLIEEYNKRPVLSSDDVIAKAYLLQSIGESEQEKDSESDLEL